VIALHDLPPISPEETVQGDAGVVDLWVFRYGETAYDALLQPDELERRDRFYFEQDRRMFVATRALARTTLSRYAAVAPEVWRFAAGPHDKPYIAAPTIVPPLHFNLSNTRGLVVCAVSIAHSQVGVDAEALDRAGETVKVADRFFAPDEVRALRALPESHQRERFFTYWTLKESYIKARGMGLLLPLEQFAFSVGEEITITFDERLRDDPSRWRFALVQPRSNHLVAVGADTGGAPLKLRAAELTSL
jgi:4'-phosphopantetheinyl transferase